ncbi:MAG TPA: hypothetical protein VFY93_07965 [Planctomycetota bacterium]|nr:hypothetical protein [Planctomycetota bacterium]
MQQQEPLPPWLRKTGLVLLVLWGVLFLLGAMGELFGIQFLRDLTDLKRIFLR